MSPDCGREWTRKHRNERLTECFLKGAFKHHKEKILCDRQKALLPQTQWIVLERKRHETFNKQIADVDLEIKNLNAQIKKLREHKLVLTNSYIRQGTVSAMNKPTKQRQFIRQCAKENCRGFISEKWVCGLCEGTTCKKCHEFLGNGNESEAHECKEGDVATAQLLMKETKPCPTCATLIYKIDGCDQMWCTQCQTAFSWKSGEVERKHIHNPHYYDWLRSQSANGVIRREPGDQCNEVTEVSQYFGIQLENRMRRLGINHLYASKEVRYWITSVVQLNHTEIVKFRRNNQEEYENSEYLEIRVKFMTGQIDEATMEKMLQKKDKEISMNREIFQVLQMYSDVMRDILITYYNQVGLMTQVEANAEISHVGLNGLKRIWEYANTCLLEIAETYQCTPYALTTMYNFSHASHRNRALIVRLSKKPSKKVLLESNSKNVP